MKKKPKQIEPPQHYSFSEIPTKWDEKKRWVVTETTTRCTLLGIDGSKPPAPPEWVDESPYVGPLERAVLEAFVLGERDGWDQAHPCARREVAEMMARILAGADPAEVFRGPVGDKSRTAARDAEIVQHYRLWKEHWPDAEHRARLKRDGIVLGKPTDEEIFARIAALGVGPSHVVIEKDESGHVRMTPQPKSKRNMPGVETVAKVVKAWKRTQKGL